MFYFDADARKEFAKEAGIFWAGDVTQGVPCRRHAGASKMKAGNRRGADYPKTQ